ncbi:MAG: Nif3-like dinuclear metal center hexameric protein [Christensenella sp.]
MSVTLKQTEALIERIAPREFAEDWDNSGFNVNAHNANITGIMICLDVSFEVITEAVQKGCNLIISHHPLLFNAVKNIDTDTYVGQCVAALLSHNISLYCAHTSMDSAPDGINTWLGDIFGLKNRRYIENGVCEKFYEVAVHVPKDFAEDVRAAMTAAGAGRIGDYSDCTYNICGKGMFCPNENAHPYIGTARKTEEVDEIRISSICSEKNLKNVLAEIRRVHPYEEPAISVLPTDSPRKLLSGLGIVGELPDRMSARDAVDMLKTALQTDSVRVAGDLNKEIGCIGVCGGAAGEFGEAARKMGAEMFITGEIKHNLYAERKDMILVEAGHFDTEKCFCELYERGLQKLLNDVHYNIAIYVTNLRRPYVNY